MTLRNDNNLLGSEPYMYDKSVRICTSMITDIRYGGGSGSFTLTLTRMQPTSTIILICCEHVTQTSLLLQGDN